LTSHQTFGTIEAVKAVSELFSPVAGEVGEINTSLESDAALVNRDPYGDGWMVKLKISGPSDLEGLLSPSEYRAHIGE
ncbi:MAG: glycine cleavage system protein H, partial [Chloroflexota bacterium]|nr:glycine cleavage system protein H [Chloroflexota bacterium]